MKFLTTMSLASAVAVALSGSAFAQMMVGAQQVSKEDMAKVTEYCATLKSSGAVADTVTEGSGSTKGTQTGDGSDSGTGSSAGGGSGQKSVVAPQGGLLNLTAITVKNCQDAGLKTM